MHTGHDLARRHKNIVFSAIPHLEIFFKKFRFSNISQYIVEDAHIYVWTSILV